MMKQALFVLLLMTMASLAMAQNRLEDYCIVLPQRHSELEHRAAEELQRHLGMAVGRDLPILNENDYQTNMKAVFLGETRWTDAELLRTDSLRSDGYLLMTDCGNLFVYAREGKGVLYGVYHLLERLGFRLYAPDALVVPHGEALTLPELDEVCNPSFAYREVLYSLPNESQYYADWHGMHNRADLARDWGLFVHTFQRLVPADRYFESHPEWFSEVAGRRVRDGQLCLSNEEVLDTLCANLALLMAQRPEAKVWSVSNNDNYNVCTCEACRKADSLYGGPSGTLVHFVNRVARRFPDKTISTLGYQFTRRAPQPAPEMERPDSNVNIMFCSIECGREASLATSPKEASFRRDMEEWAALTNNFFVWDYVAQFRSMMDPFPNLHVLQPNLKYFHDHGVEMMFEQGTGTARRTSWMGLRNYLLNKLMWDVDADAEAIVHDFCQGYYGPAAEEVEEVVRLMHLSLVASHQSLNIYGYPIDGVKGYLSPENMRHYYRLMANARQRLETLPEEERSRWNDRLRLFELSLDYAALELAMSNVSDDLTFFQGKDRRLNNDMVERADRFVADCNRLGVDCLVEMGRTPDQFRADIDNFIAKSGGRNLALGKRVRLTHEPDPQYRAGGAEGLVDGVCGLLNYTYNWLGFYGKELEAVVDLGSKTKVHEVGIDFYFFPLSWIFVPEEVEFQVSTNGRDWTTVGRVHGENPEELARPDIHHFRADGVDRKVRYVKVKARPLNEIPAWHRAVGNPCWIFADEIVVK